MTGVRSILFVCKANMCRSPSAEAVLRAMLMARGAATIEIDSAATHDLNPGAPVHPAASDAAKRRGYDLGTCTARRVIKPADFERFDMILAMDKAILEDLRRMAPTRCKQKIELLLDYGDRYYGEEIPDPIGRDAKFFDLVLRMIEDGCGGIVQLLVRAA